MLHEKVSLAWRAPFDFGRCYVDERPHGESILDMVRSIADLPCDFMQRGYVLINGEYVPRNLWAYVRPKPASRDCPICVTLHYALQSPGGGGGRGTTKSVIGLVAALALIVITGGIATGALIPAGLEGAVAGLGFLGLTGAQVLAGAVGIAGALAISALTAPPISAAGISDTSSLNQDQAEAAAASGNVIDRGGAIPRVIGTRKVFPPLACEPVVELIDQDEIVESLFVLNGPHALSNIRIDGNAIDDAEDVEFETREGWTTDTPIELITRQGRTKTPQLELSMHSLDNGGVNLQHQALPESDLPVWHGLTSFNASDQIWIHLLFPGGIYTGSTTIGSVPIRIRFRERGTTTWINVPEVHLANSSTNQFRAAILFKWATAVTMPEPPASAGFIYAHMNVPPQTGTPATPVAREWDANSYFDDGAGNEYLYNGNAASTRIRNMALYDNRVEIFLAEGTFPKTFYEIEIKRGSIIFATIFAKNTYTYTAAAVYDFFWYTTVGGQQQVAQNHSNVSDRGLVVRLLSIWDDAPLTETGFAQIAITAINRSIRSVSCTASGYVRDWDGSGWNTVTTTSNPAPHYADILCGNLNLDPLPTDLRDSSGLVAWRTLCSTNQWTSDIIVNDTRTQDVLNLLASCGYARPYQSDIYGVIVDNDRSADSPVQIFSRRNSANMRFERAFARVPAGLNITYRSEADDDDQAQTTVYQTDPTDSDLTLLESVSYEGLLSEAKVRARAKFDLDQANSRSTFYYLDADIESIVCRRGSLIGVEHDVLTDRAGDGYVASKQTSAGNITGVTLDAAIPIANELDMHAVVDMHLVADMHLVGVTTGIVIRRTDGTLSTHTLSNVTGSSNVLTFVTPFADVATIQGFADNDRKYGCMVVAGNLGSVYRRLLVQSIAPTKDLQATLVMVDEAPELVRYSP